METELIDGRHHFRPAVHRLARAKPADVGHVLCAAVMPDRVQLKHARHGNGRCRKMSTAATAAPATLIHNPAMRGQKHEAESTFPGRLREAMERKSINANQIQVAMARAGFHLPRQTIGNMLRGRTKVPRWDKLVIISAFLGVRPEWLADGVLPMIPTPTLDESELQLVQAFRALSQQHRRDLCDIAERWAETDAEAPGPSRGRYDPRAPKQ